MSIKFTPNYTITSKIASDLMRIEAAKIEAAYLPLTPQLLKSLRESAHLKTTHYSTIIEGNRLTIDQIEGVLKYDSHFPGRERDEREIRGYYTALAYVEKIAKNQAPITEKIIQIIHALVMSDKLTLDVNQELKKLRPSPYRELQNMVADGATRRIVYMPPEASDVPKLMRAMVEWLNEIHLPCPLIAAIAHYQFATIHPYMDGNGRTARLLTTLILHKGGYDLKGIYCLEEYYAKNLNDYYQAISIGPSHNYYEGRPEADITPWVEYFIAGMTHAFESVLKQMRIEQSRGAVDLTSPLALLDPLQRKALELFKHSSTITTKQIGELFDYKPRTSASLCAKWVKSGFLEIANFSNKGRKYALAKKYTKLISEPSSV